MIRLIRSAALAAVLALGFATTASAAFVEAEATDLGGGDFLIEVFIMLEMDRQVASVDVGIEAAGATFSNITNEGTFFEGKAFGPANSILPGDTVAFFTGSDLFDPATTPALTRLFLGTVIASTSSTPTDLIISTGALFEIAQPDGTLLNSPSQDRGAVLTTLDVPEPATFVLLGLALAGLSLRRRG